MREKNEENEWISLQSPAQAGASWQQSDHQSWCISNLPSLVVQLCCTTLLQQQHYKLTRCKPTQSRCLTSFNFLHNSLASSIAFRHKNETGWVTEAVLEMLPHLGSLCISMMWSAAIRTISRRLREWESLNIRIIVINRVNFSIKKYIFSISWSIRFSDAFVMINWQLDCVEIIREIWIRDLSGKWGVITSYWDIIRCHKMSWDVMRCPPVILACDDDVSREELQYNKTSAGQSNVQSERL